MSQQLNTDRASSAKIASLSALEILDSRGYPTLRATARLSNGISAAASVPSGASTGSREACELRDGDPQRYRGRGVLRAVENVNTVLNELLSGRRVGMQQQLDRAMCDADGTALKSRYGANAILGASLAILHSAAAAAGQPLYRYIAQLQGCDHHQSWIMPVPMMNILNGGAHAANNLDLQEFMIQPLSAGSFSEALRWGAEIFHSLCSQLKQQGISTAVGDEGGVAPDLPNHRAALDTIMTAIDRAGFKPGREIGLALDCAASEFYRDGRYWLAAEGQSLDAAGFVGFLADLCRDYPILSIEDGLAEDDWQGWQLLTQVLGKQLQLVGDDLFVSDTATLASGIEGRVANSILVKLNQVGTVSQTLEVIALAREKNYGTVISHRSGETEDTTIADLAVGTAAGQIKTGAPCRSDRVAKYNRLLCIEQELGAAARLYRLPGGGLESGRVKR